MSSVDKFFLFHQDLAAIAIMVGMYVVAITIGLVAGYIDDKIEERKKK